MKLSTEQKVGLFFLVTLMVLGVIIELVEDWKPFEKQFPYRTYFTSAVGIKIGDPVRMAGVEIGKVKGISLEGQRVRVDFIIREGTEIREDSIASVRQMNLLGGQFLGVSFGSSDARVLNPDSAIASEQRANVDQLISNLDRNQEEVLGALKRLLDKSGDPFVEAVQHVQSIARKIDGGEGMIGKLINEDGLYTELEASVKDLKRFLAKIEKGEGALGRLMNDPKLYEEATATVSNLRTISERLKKGEGTVGKLLVDDRMYQDGKDALANMREITGKANEGKGSLGKLVNEDALYDEAHGALKKINSIAGKIDEGKGTIGQLVNQDDLYRDAKTTLHKVEKAADSMSDTGPVSALGTVVGTLF